jgi:hypothetical protein
MKHIFASLSRCRRELLWRLSMAWDLHQFAQSDKMLEEVRTAARLQAHACLTNQWGTEGVPKTRQSADRLAQFAADRYARSKWRPKRLRRLVELAAPDIFRNKFRETLLPKADSLFHHGGPLL